VLEGISQADGKECCGAQWLVQTMDINALHKAAWQKRLQLVWEPETLTEVWVEGLQLWHAVPNANGNRVREKILLISLVT
jgi:hypothetical protein